MRFQNKETDMDINTKKHLELVDSVLPMKPDFELKTVRLFNCDNMQFMKTIPDNFYELAIVDPPYGIDDKISTNSKLNKGNKFAQLYNKKRWDKKRPTLIYWDELMRISKNQIVCGGNYFADKLPISRGWIFWDKQGDGMSSVNNELIWTSFNISIKTFSRCHGLDKGFMADHKVFHPTTKSRQLYKWLFTNYAKVGDKIIDTHGGSMSSGCAAMDMGFEMDICEIDNEYFDNAVERLKNNVQDYFDFA
jgi:site-specific DNA-methyltransferase (adenine-specific)